MVLPVHLDKILIPLCLNILICKMGIVIPSTLGIVVQVIGMTMRRARRIAPTILWCALTVCSSVQRGNPYGPFKKPGRNPGLKKISNNKSAASAVSFQVR